MSSKDVGSCRNKPACKRVVLLATRQDSKDVGSCKNGRANGVLRGTRPGTTTTATTATTTTITTVI